MMAKIETIRVRVETEEKKRVEAMIRNIGYRSISDFIRDNFFKPVNKDIDPKEIDYIILRLTKIREKL